MKNNYSIKKLAAIFICLLFASPMLLAQSKTLLQSGGGGGFTIGYGFMDVSKLHDFVPAGVNKFTNSQFLIGGTGHGYIGRLVMGGSGFGIQGDEISTDSFKYKLGGGIGTFDIGYLLLDKEKVKIYPMIGIGGGGFGLRIAQNKNVSLNEVVNNPSREINISKGGFVFDVSVNLNFIPSLTYNEQDNSYGGFMIGLKAGYLFSMPSSNWEFSGGDVTGGPRFGLNMPYIKLILGGFGFQKK